MRHRCCVCRCTLGPDTTGAGTTDGYCRRHELETLERYGIANPEELAELKEMRRENP